MTAYSLTEVRYPDKPARYFVDGKRVSKDAYEALTTRARMFGRLECFSTRAVPLPDGTFKRFNYSTATV
ncbi:MAG: hypothetical protein HYU59_05840 [Magnetospirillum gryphiswaldense]|nr:hypothetical protein [Magnetospirillum gryphiswaldense]